MVTDLNSPELLAPAGNWECVRAAAANGADAIYFGLPRFNARLRADNFSETDLPEVVKFCHLHGVKAYVAFNTLVFTGELDDAEAYLRLLNECGVDALIVQDAGLVTLARKIVPELHIHASTQMTITSPEGVQFARDLGVERVVLAREISLRELEKFDPAEMPLEVFVHGALCVAYSGQCLTSESLGQRSANRGECAQACRMPYQMVVDGAVKDLGDRRYLLSPQDLAAVHEIPALIERGVVSFKIEGRLKSPEYVAAVCQVYRKALDAAMAQREEAVTPDEKYQLEMTFSRGLSSGWMHGVDHQMLVPARYGKKRGPFVGRVEKAGPDFIFIDSAVPLALGDGLVFDTGGDTNTEQGGRIYALKGKKIEFQRGKLNAARIPAGTRVWKTDDPALEKRLRQSYAGAIEPRSRKPLALRVEGKAGEAMRVSARLAEARVESEITVASSMLLQEARTAPLTAERLCDHLGKLSDTPFSLGEFQNELAGNVILPIGELNRIRRELAARLIASLELKRPSSPLHWHDLLLTSEPVSAALDESHAEAARLSVLCRSMEQLEAAAECEPDLIYIDFEDIRRCKDGVALLRERAPHIPVYVATPRIQKAGEQGFFKVIETAEPDGVLVRNLGGIAHFASACRLPMTGDFSLNVANPLTARHLLGVGLERLTVSYDLNIEQVLDLLHGSDASRFELTLHQHMPMFHMEHCAFAAFLSKGSSHLDCGRPCETHRVSLRDRVGVEHPLRADVGCRNTLFNAVAQTGAQFFEALQDAGLRRYRVELLEETPAETRKTLLAYRALIRGERDGFSLWRDLKAQSQLGVTRGTL